VLLLALVPSLAPAAGLFTPDSSVAALGRAGAFVARADDVVGALVHNPAGLAQIDGLHVTGGLLLMRTERWYERTLGDQTFDRTTMAEGLVRPIPEFGIAYGWADPDITLALGLHTPMAPLQAFDADGPGRYRLVEQELIEARFSLSGAWRPVPWLSIGGGFQLLYLLFEQSLTASADLIAARNGAATNPEDPDWDVATRFKATQWRPHAHVGLLVEPLPWLRIGAYWSPPYGIDGRGTVELEGIVGEEFFSDGIISSLYGDEPVHLRGTDEDFGLRGNLPMDLKVGVGFEPIADVLDFEVDAHMQFWRGSDLVISDVDVAVSHITASGDAIPVVDYLTDRGVCDFLESGGLDCASLAVYRGGDGTGVVTTPTGYDLAWSVRAGGTVTPVPWLALRFGYGFESDATPDRGRSLTMLDGDKHLAAGGLTFKPGPLTVHVSYAHVFHGTNTVAEADSEGITVSLPGVPTNPVDAGTYGGATNTLGISLGLNVTKLAEIAKKANDSGQ